MCIHMHIIFTDGEIVVADTNAAQHTFIIISNSMLQHAATRCNTLQHAAAHCNTLHHTYTHLHIVFAEGTIIVAQPQAAYIRRDI